MNPPVLRYDLVPDADLSADTVPAHLAALVGGAVEAADVLRHGGLWVDRVAWSGGPIPAGAAVTAYRFSREPAPVPLPEPVVLWEHGAVLAANKPAWLPVQGTRASRVLSLEHMLRQELDAPTLTAVHRLDRETSGVVLFARTGAAAARLHRQFRERRVSKTYMAVVRGAPAEARFSVRGEMHRASHAAHSLFALREAAAGETPGQSSETRFARLGPAPLEGCTLVAARPITGRTHQIRVHLAAVGCPIVGDALYGSPPGPGQPPVPRLQLHAYALAFDDEAGRRVVVAPPPADFTTLSPAAASAVSEPDRLDQLFEASRRIALGTCA